VNTLKSLLIFLTAVLFACAGHQPINTTVPEKTFFPTNYQGRPLTGAPETWTDYYDGGTYLFLTGKYSLAAEYFLNGAQIASGNDAKRACLAAAAVSALGADDTAQFINAREQLRDLTSRDPFSEPTVTDRALKELEKVTR